MCQRYAFALFWASSVHIKGRTHTPIPPPPKDRQTHHNHIKYLFQFPKHFRSFKSLKMSALPEGPQNDLVYCTFLLLSYFFLLFLVFFSFLTSFFYYLFSSHLVYLCFIVRVEWTKRLRTNRLHFWNTPFPMAKMLQ